MTKITTSITRCRALPSKSSRLWSSRAITIEAVATSADVPIGSVYQFFPNKHALIAELSREDTEAALIVQRSMAKDGVRFLFNASTARLQQRDGEKVVIVRHAGDEEEIVCDQILSKEGGLEASSLVDTVALVDLGNQVVLYPFPLIP